MTVRALAMPVGPDWYAVEVGSVREVVVQPPLTAVPTAPEALLGVFNLRGEIVPLFDTGALLGLGPMPAGPFAAIVRTSIGPAGLAVTGAPESVDLGEPVTAEVVAGVATYALGPRLVTLVDVEQLLVPDGIGGPGT
jgi:purine-binding chemotaxis protein CheW